MSGPMGSYNYSKFHFLFHYPYITPMSSLHNIVVSILFSIKGYVEFARSFAPMVETKWTSEWKIACRLELAIFLDSFWLSHVVVVVYGSHKPFPSAVGHYMSIVGFLYYS